jgi:DNA invertase Pin-like site-specific DNA recombinase/peptidoglycan hydrolase-like protein with peptidoglycan-binding domain
VLTELVAKSDRIQIKPVLVVLAALTVVAAVAVPAPASAATRPAPVLAQGAGMGSKPNAAVRRVQQVLHHRGYSLGRPGVDGRFGPLTAAAVRHLQSDYGLAVDGIVGPKTDRLVGLLKRRASGRTSAPGSQSPPSNQSSPPTTKPAQPAPSPTATQPVTPVTPIAQKSDDDATVIIIAALAALAAFALALWQLLRTSSRKRTVATPAATAITHELYLEGRSDDPKVGEFRGHALAATVPENPGEQPAPERTSYLVDDVRKQAPVWVRGDEIQRSGSRLESGAQVMGYVTVTADAARAKGDEPAPEIAESARQIEEVCARGEWDLVEVVTDRENGASLDRPGLSYALKRIADGEARGLVVSDLRRLSHSVVDLGALMEWFRDARAALIALDLDLDTSTPRGQEIAATLITLGGWERERMLQRTRSGITAVRAGGRSPGRPAVADRPALVERITAMREAGMTLQGIADQLNAEDVPTLRGGVMWRPSSVQAALGYRRPSARGPRDQLPPLEGRG